MNKQICQPLFSLEYGFKKIIPSVWYTSQLKSCTIETKYLLEPFPTHYVFLSAIFFSLLYNVLREIFLLMGFIYDQTFSIILECYSIFQKNKRYRPIFPGHFSNFSSYFTLFSLFPLAFHLFTSNSLNFCWNQRAKSALYCFNYKTQTLNKITHVDKSFFLEYSTLL